MIYYILFYLTLILYEASGRPPNGSQSNAVDQFSILRTCRRQHSTGSSNCQARIKRWYYDSSAKICRPFKWTGCGGNDNRFESREECESRCRGVPPCTRPSLPRQTPDGVNPDGCVRFKAINIHDGCPVYHWDCQEVPRTGSCPPAIDLGPLPKDCWISTIRTTAGCAKDIVTCS